MFDGLLSDAFCLEAVRMAMDAALKGTFLVAFAGLLTLVLRRGSAHLRSQVWTFTLIGLAAIPLLSAAAPLWRLPLLPDILDLGAVLRGLGAGEMTGTAVPLVSDGTVTAETGRAATGGLSGHWSRWGLWLLMAGAGLQALWIVLSRWSLQRIVRGAEPVDMSWRPLVDTVRSSLGLQRPVRLVKSAAVKAGITVGTLRPLVILPADAESWPVRRRRFTVSHELAHVKRWDALIEDLGVLVMILHWFNPLVRLALQRLRIEREKDCDNRVLLAGAKPSDYAQQLLEIAADLEGGPQPVWRAAWLSQGSHLKDRLLHILNPGAARRASGRAAVAVAGLIVLAAALPLAAMSPWTESTISNDVADIALPAKSQEYWKNVKNPESSAAMVAEKIIASHGRESAVAFLEKILLEGKSPDGYEIREKEINELGYRMLRQEKRKEALAVFRFNVQAFPDAWNVHDSLGEAYVEAGQLDQAAKAYKKSLALGSENVEGARKMLHYIEQQKKNLATQTS